MNGKKRLARGFWLLALGLTLSLLIFPIAPWAADKTAGSCAPLGALSVLFAVLVSGIWSSAIASMLGGFHRAGTYFLATAYSTAVWGIWWLSLGLFVLECSVKTESNNPKVIFLVGASVLALLIACFAIPRLKKVIVLNPRTFDTTDMAYRPFIPLRRLDGTRMSAVGSTLVGIGLIGVLLGRYLSATDTLLIVVTCALGALILGGLFGGQMYLAWFAYSRSAQADKPMTVRLGDG